LADVAEAAGNATAGAVITAFTFASGTSITLDDDDALKFDLVFNGEAKTVTIDKATVDAALSATDGVIGSATDMDTVLTAALKNAGLTEGSGGDVTVAAGSGNTVTITHNTAAADKTLEIKNADSSDNGNFFDATTFDITDASTSQLNSYMQGIDKMLSKITTAASDLGAIKTRIGSQQDFVGKLMDAVERGVGQLVDADMDEESTRLKALQTQQQLGIQALSIANSNSQNILSLFRS
jgi:flagellin